MLQLQNICKSFHRMEVLKGISLTVKPGEVVAILGPSGSGKSTLLRCINFLERPNHGLIQVGDLVVQTEKATNHEILQLRRITAMVFQNYHLFKNKTALENVMEGLLIVKQLSRDEAQQKSVRLLEKVGLAERMNHYPSQLSGGQQQRVGIARALALEPKVILFDEPTSALDPELVGEVLEVIRTLAREGRTMIVVTHEMHFAHEVASHVVFMDEGRIVEEGNASEVFEHTRQERTKHFLQKIQAI
ncbi:MAG TPA: amino acid ABC transporter ATP-binding protein [Firmicutes bacterium]|jgi:L-cystine transport system ATP-binding protein|nr:amino acid ABC transporter ATP-binding protein [Bacillota bacterium]